MNAARTPPRPHTGAKPSVDDIQRLISAQLGLPSRLGHTLLLLVSLGAAGVITTLLVTEPDLPARTSIAMGVMVVIAVSWSVFAAWVLVRRRVLLARHRVVAAQMAIGFTTIFTLGAWGVASQGAGTRSGYGAVGVALAMLAIAVVMLVRARRRVGELSRRRAELERRHAAGEGTPR